MALSPPTTETNTINTTDSTREFRWRFSWICIEVLDLSLWVVNFKCKMFVLCTYCPLPASLVARICDLTSPLRVKEYIASSWSTHRVDSLCSNSTKIYIYTTTNIKNKRKVYYTTRSKGKDNWWRCILVFILNSEGNQSTTNMVVLYYTLSHAIIYIEFKNGQ